MPRSPPLPAWMPCASSSSIPMAAASTPSPCGLRARPTPWDRSAELQLCAMIIRGHQRPRPLGFGEAFGVAILPAVQLLLRVGGQVGLRHDPPVRIVSAKPSSRWAESCRCRHLSAPAERSGEALWLHRACQPDFALIQSKAGRASTLPPHLHKTDGPCVSSSRFISCRAQNPPTGASKSSAMLTIPRRCSSMELRLGGRSWPEFHKLQQGLCADGQRFGLRVNRSAVLMKTNYALAADIQVRI